MLGRRKKDSSDLVGLILNYSRDIDFTANADFPISALIYHQIQTQIHFKFLKEQNIFDDDFLLF